MKKKLAIIGGGTAGMFLAAFIDTDIYDVTMYEKNATLGRKFLVAGDGGFNLTHSEELSTFKKRYTPDSFLNKALDCFSNTDLSEWLLSLDIPTFKGSSGRVFPKKGIKPIQVLKSIEAHLIKRYVKFEFKKTFTGWDNEGALIFNSEEVVSADYSVFSMGGASWKVTGSNGSWLEEFSEKGIDTIPFRSSNCAFKIHWDNKFIQNNEGKPLKNIAISINGKTQKGEAVITKFGIEGNAIYALSPDIQAILASKSEAIVFVDFKTPYSLSKIKDKISHSKSNTTSTLKEELKLPRVVIDLLKTTLSKEEFLDIEILSKYIKSFPLTIVDSAEIDEAISTSGGIDLKAVNGEFELKKIANTYCIGEMLDWDAPTGGYLVQGCASMGVYLAELMNGKKKR
jgi:uncharacterized flavoprotein (TIGR03862 family)